MATGTYDEWVEALGAFFFDEAHNGEEILFAVDEDTLAEISGLTPSEARESLAHAVESVIGRQWYVSSVWRLVRRWKAGGYEGDHPALPYLGLTVLAASRMGAFDGVPTHNFYIPLRQTLNPEDLDDGCPGEYLDYVKVLWSSLQEWANDFLRGRRGRIEIRDPGPLYGRGYATQHALVKSSDLDQLDAFFRRIGLEPGEEVAPAELFRALQAWTTGRNEPWAKRLCRICTDTDLEEYAKALLSREANQWDGKPRDPRTGRAVGRIRVGVESLKRPTVGFFIQFDERLPETVQLQLTSSTTIELERQDGWYQPAPIDGLDTASTLSNGIDLQGSGYRFTLRPDSVYALAHDEDLGAWVSTDRMSFGDRYHLLARYEVVESIRRFCVAAGATEIQVLDQAASVGLPNGWQLIRNVRLDARPTDSPPACLASLIPVGSGPRLRLVGGLPLPQATGLYLCGGEPSLALSTLCDDEHLTLTKTSTGESHKIRISALASKEVDLSVFNLAPGTYEITHGDSSVSITIVDGIADEAGPGAGTVCAINEDGVEVRGTILQGVDEPETPVIIPAPQPNKPVYLLGANPSELICISFPHWFCEEAGALSWTSFDAWPWFQAVWAIPMDPAVLIAPLLPRAIKPESGPVHATLLSPREVSDFPPDRDARWARILRAAELPPGQTDDAVELWHKYQTAAEGTR
jgi:hypothetical protein